MSEIKINTPTLVEEQSLAESMETLLQFRTKHYFGMNN